MACFISKFQQQISSFFDLIFLNRNKPMQQEQGCQSLLTVQRNKAGFMLIFLGVPIYKVKLQWLGIRATSLKLLEAEYTVLSGFD